MPYCFYIDKEGHLELGMDTTQGFPWIVRSSTAVPADGQSHRVAVTRARVTTVSSSGSVTVTWKVRFFIDGTAVGEQETSGIEPGTGNQPLELGRVHLSVIGTAMLEGVLSDVRLWSVVRTDAQLGATLTGSEDGLLCWWRLGDVSSTAHDARSQRDGKVLGATRVRSLAPDELLLYVDGQLVATERQSSPPPTDPQQMCVGGSMSDGQVVPFEGELAELRLWSVPRTHEQLLDSMFRPLVGERGALVAYYQPLVDGSKVLDGSGRGRMLELPGDAVEAVISTAPVGTETPWVRNALTGIRTDLSGTVECRPAVGEYVDVQYDARGEMGGAMKRCYAHVVEGRWHLITGFKIGNLISEWVGQVQYDPQLIGYIEGAPPVPSENLTSTGLKNGEYADYGGASAVSIVDASNTVYTYSMGAGLGIDASLDVTARFGSKSKTESGQFVLTTIEETKAMVGPHLQVEVSSELSRSDTVGAGQNVTRCSRLQLTGTWEDTGAIGNKDIGRRFIPANVGFALVKSETADLFALRLEHDKTLVSFTMRPNPDIPKDINILTFPINPRYCKQGTLDGRVGLKYDADYNLASGGGEHSYYKPKEAYRLKRAIDREAEELRNIYGGSTAGYLFAARLPKLHRRNIVNTYVWTADGGTYAESTETMDVREESLTASFDFKVMVGVSSKIMAMITKVGMIMELDILLGFHAHLETSKSLTSEDSFSLDVEVEGERDIVEYDEEKGPIYDADGKPRRQTGKVDAYRFMSFYMRPSVEHFDKFVDTVVDLIWLAQDNSPSAVALRQAVGSQASASDQNKSMPWRVFHRVTFISRVFSDKGQQPNSTEDRLRAADIDSNYELIRRFEPFVIDRKDDGYTVFADAVRSAVRNYLPAELQVATDDIVTYLCQYYGVYAD